MAIGNCWLLFCVTRSNISDFVILEEQKNIFATITEVNIFAGLEI